MKKRLVATDFDGTLNRNGSVSVYDREMIAKWRAAGNYFGVVTGRGEDFVEKAKERGVEYDYLIVYNGSLILDCDGNHIYENLISRDMFKKLEAYLSSCENMEYCDVATDDEFYFQHYSTCNEPEQALVYAEKINEMYGDTVTAFVNGPHINVAQKPASKANSVKIILSHFGLKADEAAVVGDDYNDLDMITQHNGWAVDTARPAVLEVAPHVCKSVGALIEELLK